MLLGSIKKDSNLVWLLFYRKFISNKSCQLNYTVKRDGTRLTKSNWTLVFNLKEYSFYFTTLDDYLELLANLIIVVETNLNIFRAIKVNSLTLKHYFGRFVFMVERIKKSSSRWVYAPTKIRGSVVEKEFEI